MVESLLSGELSLSRTAIVLFAVATLACVDLIGRIRREQHRYAFAALFGTLLGVGLIRVTHVLFSPALPGGGPAMALGVLLLIVGWRFLFGPWDSQVKATVLGTFVFWIFAHMLWAEPSSLRLAHLLAIGIAAIPATIWCLLFLPYHRERLSLVLLMFFSGMLATVPILFYDALVRNGAELQFFVFSLKPESFHQTIQAFVREWTPEWLPLGVTLLSLFFSYMFVGLLEEGSKYWVLRRNGQRFFGSIDDALQLAIVVAIGFAFAENVTSTGYFLSFVREYITEPVSPDWGAFLGNVAGRSILTSMVHIVSTGTIGYFLGKAIFAEPVLMDAQSAGRRFFLVESFHRILGFDRTSVYRTEMLLLGISIATVLHAFCNFLVTLPDVLPGNPHTLGDLLGASASSPLHFVALLLIPALLYVVGGFLLLTHLFTRKENLKERGAVIPGNLIVSV